MNENDGEKAERIGPYFSIDRIIKWARTELKRPDPIGIPLIIISLVFFILLVFSPILVEEDTLDFGDEGTVGSMDHDEEISNINNSFARAIYRFGDRYCHQKDHRSWEINGNQMPVCARDIGLFLGIFLGCIFGACYRRGIKFLVILALLAPMVIDGGLQSVTSYESLNFLRLVTGALGGFGIGAFVNGSLIQTIRILTFKRKKG
jgi:uncharacterized membrane protein